MPDYNTGEVDFSNWKNYNKKRENRPDFGKEVNEEPSMTVPGESLTIKEIMEKALRGIQPDPRPVEFLDVDDIEEINEFFAPGSLDLTDLDAMRSKTKSLMDLVEKAKAKEDTFKAIDDAAEKLLKDSQEKLPEKEKEGESE